MYKLGTIIKEPPSEYYWYITEITNYNGTYPEQETWYRGYGNFSMNYEDTPPGAIKITNTNYKIYTDIFV